MAPTVTVSPAELRTASRPFYGGIDLGGTNTKVGVIDSEGRALARTSVGTRVDAGPELGVQMMASTLRELLEALGCEGVRDLAAIGLGTPGTMDIPGGMLLEPHNLPGWFDFPIVDRLQAHCEGRPVAFTNDASAAAYGEYWVGRGREHQSMLLLTLGTGVGGGIIIGDAPLDGEHSHGAECGHIIIDYHPDALICSCGQPGHLEAYASATGVTARAKAALATGEESALTEKLAEGKRLTPLLIADEAQAGDEFCMRIVLETARYLAIGITTLMHVIDPSAVVLGGGMNFGGAEHPLGKRFLEAVRTEVKSRAFPVLAEKTIIDFATLHGNAGFIGAAGLAKRRFGE
ncbi:MAG: ROK family protein [Pirellulales bacterium]|nr:ROK family protein [Pirellulales bacterium]